MICCYRSQNCRSNFNQLQKNRNRMVGEADFASSNQININRVTASNSQPLISLRLFGRRYRVFQRATPISTPVCQRLKGVASMRLIHLFDDPGMRAAIAAAEDAAFERLTRLTRQQRAVLEHMLEGHPNKVIAHKLGLSQRTVENHRAEIFERTNAKSLTALIRLVLMAG
jgi:DNA-binding CsgD family transcriptional regulator